jgi:hypothetical protein
LPGDKFLRNVAGMLTEVVGTQTSAGAANAGDIVALDDNGRLDASVMPTGVGADTAAVTASEALAAGDLVNVWDSAGAFRVRKADASGAGKEAHGFVLAAVGNGASATVHFEGRDNQVTGLTPGVRFLSAATPGATVATAPTTGGQVVQRVGAAVSATELNFEPHQPIVLA